MIRVLFPIDDMDVGDYMNVTDSDEDLIYDLQSTVNHYGGELLVNSDEICDDDYYKDGEKEENDDMIR